MNGMILNLTKELKDLFRYRWLIYVSVLATLKMRYRRSVLGFFWSLLGPALNYGTLAVVFYFGLRQSFPNYIMYVFPGILAFGFVASTMNNGSVAFIANEMFLKKIYLPKSIFVVNSALSELTNFCLNLTVMMGLTLALGSFKISSSVLLLPFLILLIFIFSLGLALIIGLSTVFFRDLQHVVPIIMQALFYVTPVLYTPDTMPVEYRFLFEWNPIYKFIQLFRGVFFDPTLLNSVNVYYCIAMAAGSFMLGLICLKLNENKIVFRL